MSSPHRQLIPRSLVPTLKTNLGYHIRKKSAVSHRDLSLISLKKNSSISSSRPRIPRQKMSYLNHWKSRKLNLLAQNLESRYSVKVKKFRKFSIKRLSKSQRMRLLALLSLINNLRKQSLLRDQTTKLKYLLSQRKALKEKSQQKLLKLLKNLKNGIHLA